MTTLTSPPLSLAELAEEPDHHLDAVPKASRRLVRPRFTLLFSPATTQSTTSRVRATADDLDDTIAEVRRTLREAGYVRNVWTVGPSCRPEGLARRLLDRGFVPATRPPFEPTATAMALMKAPANASTNPAIEVRPVRSLEDYRDAIRVAMEAFNESPEDAAGWFEAVPSLWADHDGINRYTHIAFLDGRLVGMGFAVTAKRAVLLGGSGVLENARGKGVYRALVAARWEEAKRLGHEGLIIHAGAMSRPILEHCGFEKVCDIETYEDAQLMTG